MRTILSNEHLSKLLDACIGDIEEGGSKIFDIAQLFHCIGEATGDSVYDALVPTMGSFGGEIATFRPLASLPILPEPTRKKFQNIFAEAISGCKEALSILKTELCEKEKFDPALVLKAVSLLGKHDYNLTMARTSLMRPSRAMKTEE